MNYLIRAASLLTLGVYLLFSQFVVKALVTTSIPEDSRGEVGCVMKNIDTFDGKYGCWKNSNSGVMSADVVLEKTPEVFYPALVVEDTLRGDTYELIITTSPDPPPPDAPE
jgi:hypothetical protein